MSRKIDRSLYGPSVFEVTLGAILSVLLGAFVGFLFLVFKPVVIAKELPKEEDRVEATVYYVEGKDETSRDRQWMHKRQMLLDGTPGEMTLSEDEINACLNAGRPKKPTPKRPPPPKPGEPPAKPPAEEIPDELITHDVANVRIHDGIFQVGMPANLNLITFSVPLILQAQGTFVKKASMWVFSPSSVYLGSMPLNRIPGLTSLLIKRIADSTPVPDQAWAAWKRVDDVSIGGRLMHLTIVGATIESAPAATQEAPAAPATTTVTPTVAPAAVVPPSASATTPTAVPSAIAATPTPVENSAPGPAASSAVTTAPAASAPTAQVTPTPTPEAPAPTPTPAAAAAATPVPVAK